MAQTPQISLSDLNPKECTIHVRVSRDLHRWLRSFAESHGATSSKLVRVLLGHARDRLDPSEAGG